MADGQPLIETMKNYAFLSDDSFNLPSIDKHLNRNNCRIVWAEILTGWTRPLIPLREIIAAHIHDAANVN